MTHPKKIFFLALSLSLSALSLPALSNYKQDYSDICQGKAWTLTTGAASYKDPK